MPKTCPNIKTKCIEAGITQAKLAKEISTSAPYVNRVIRSKETIVNNTLVKMMEALGYDIELRYVKREKY
ncbi:helix-turn-helix domain-containing protein [Levyella massiliensis]|uniref:helix-turn-helix domain-containing protein n=1 Tax=Levyella massiliensis TaxID=938289 RepID=UPI0024AD40A3|nr:helix-turn-helix transcriptional regulator [Levyella massiliensis]